MTDTNISTFEKSIQQLDIARYRYRSLVSLGREVIRRTFAKPSCFDCAFAHIDPGYGGSRDEQPQPAMLEECRSDVPTELIEDAFEHPGKYETPEERLAAECKHFHAVSQWSCGHCNQPMDTPLYNWPLYVQAIYHAFPVCSVDCFIAETDKINAEIRELTKPDAYLRAGAEVNP